MRKTTKRLHNGLMILALTLIGCGMVKAQTYESIKMETNGSWTIPANVSKVKAEAWGGGGAGGYASGSFLQYRASGGGGGAAYSGVVFPVELNGSKKIEVTNIRGGQSSSNNNNVTDGGNTTVSYDGVVRVVAEGGKSVRNTNNTTGANGGKASNSTGTWKFSGGNGSNGTHGSIGGGGGGAAGSSADGENGEESTVFSAEGGASGGDLGGAGGTGLTGASDVEDGSNYGGGGSGVCTGAATWIGGKGYSRTGGNGAPGIVRFTYMPFYINNITASVTAGSQSELSPVSNLSDLSYRIESQDDIDNISFSISLDNPDKIMITDITNNTGEIKTVVVTMAGVWNDNIDTERGFDTLTRIFTITLNIYPEINPGKIGEEIVTCTETDTLKRFINIESANDNLTSTGAVLTYCWQFSEDNISWTTIPGADDENYTPGGDFSNSGWFRRGAYNAVPDTAFTEAINTTVGNIQPGEITLQDNATEQGEYCLDESINVSIKANPVIGNEAYQTNYSIQWQKKIDNGEWTDIEGATEDTYSETFTLGTANNGEIADSVLIRYMFRFADCATEPSSNTYKQKMLISDEHYEPVLTEEQTVTLWYGACDTAVVIPALDPEPISIECSETRLTVGTHNVVWTVREPCGGVMTYEQTINVEYPECEQDVNIDGVAYPVIRVGCECWLAKNLRIEADDATYYKNDEYNSAFGRLYSWETALKGSSAQSSDSEEPQAVQPLSFSASAADAEVEVSESRLGSYVQGVCPDGWAIPTNDQFMALFEATGGTDKLKSDDPTTWLPNKSGVAPVSGFDAVGAGYYDSELDAYCNKLATNYIWTSEVDESSIYGTCCSFSYSCPVVRLLKVKKSIHSSVRCVRVSTAE